MMPDMYTRTIIDGNAKLYGGLLRRLSEPDNLPTLIHCTAGKDRTGVAVALLLLLLGVPDEVVVADYSLSNLYFDTFFEYGKRVAHSLRWFGVRAEDLSPLFMANPETLRTTITHIRAKYGSVEGYLRDAAGLDDATMAHCGQICWKVSAKYSVKVKTEKYRVGRMRWAKGVAATGIPFGQKFCKFCNCKSQILQNRWSGHNRVMPLRLFML